MDNNNGLFEYTCRFFDCTDNDIKEVHGIVYANSFKDASYKLERYYDEIESLKLIETDACFDVYEFETSPVDFSIIVNENGENQNE